MKIDCDLLLNVTDLTNIWLGYCKTSCKQMSNNKKEARNYDNSHKWVKKLSMELMCQVLGIIRLGDFELVFC